MNPPQQPERQAASHLQGRAPHGRPGYLGGQKPRNVGPACGEAAGPSGPQRAGGPHFLPRYTLAAPFPALPLRGLRLSEAEPGAAVCLTAMRLFLPTHIFSPSPRLRTGFVSCPRIDTRSKVGRINGSTRKQDPPPPPSRAFRESFQGTEKGGERRPDSAQVPCLPAQGR